MNDEIRRAHAIMECDNEISFCKMIINGKSDEAAKEAARKRLKVAEAKKKEIQSAM